jgi:hypothetical protein
MPLDVRALVLDVAELRCASERPGALNHRIRSIDPEHRSRRRESRRLARRLPGPAPDVEHPVRGVDSVRAPQHVVEMPQFEVVVDHGWPLGPTDAHGFGRQRPLVGLTIGSRRFRPMLSFT